MKNDEPPDCAFASPEDPRWESLTPAQAQAAYEAAVPVPLSEGRIQEIVHYATSAQDSPGPQTHDEARQFHEGFLAGATAYCAAIGHSCLKSDNPKLREVFDAQGWKTIEVFESLAEADAIPEQLEGFDCHAGFAPGSDEPIGDNTATKLTCANCGEISVVTQFDLHP